MSFHPRIAHQDSRNLQGNATSRQDFLESHKFGEKWKSDRPPPIPPKTYRSVSNFQEINYTEYGFYKNKPTYADEYDKVVPFKKTKLSQTFNDETYSYIRVCGESLKDLERRKVCY